MTNIQKSLFKSLTYRFISIIITFSVSYMVTGSLAVATSIGVIDTAIKVVVYFGHERLWHKIYGSSKTKKKELKKAQYKAHQQ